MRAFHSKQAQKGILEVKNLSKVRILGCFSKAKTEECDQKVGNILDQFGINISCSAKYFLEKAPRVSLKLATKESLRGKRTTKN